MSSCQVSVVIVTRGRADVLGDCLLSLKNQTRAPDQIVIVAGDDESCPIGLLDDIDNCVRVMCPEPNICKARNIGLDHATGSIVLFIDDDATAEPKWIEAYINAFTEYTDAWVAGGLVYDARTQPAEFEFAHGVIRPSGSQIEVRSDPQQPLPEGFVPTVKGCNFAIHTGRMPEGMRFDPFFRFAFDEADLVLRVHSLGGGVVKVSDAIVHHLHSPGLYRASHPLDRDWFTEYASHTMYMLKHTRGVGRLTGWGVVIRRATKHTLVGSMAAITGRVGHKSALTVVLDAWAGIRFAAMSHGSAQASQEY